MKAEYTINLLKFQNHLKYEQEQSFLAIMKVTEPVINFDLYHRLFGSNVRRFASFTARPFPPNNKKAAILG